MIMNLFPPVRWFLNRLNESKNITCKLLELETCILCLFWNDILERINRVNVIFQKERLTLNVVVDHMKSLTEYLKTIRENFTY